VITFGGGVFDGDLDAGDEAYVDRDWIVEGPVSALSGTLDDAKRRLLAAAEAAVAAAASSEDVTVCGEGCVAGRVRMLLHDRLSSDPDLVIELRSSDEDLRESTERVADLGTVVLAGPPAGSFRFDLYPDVHVRGLRVISLPFTAGLAAGSSEALEEPATVRLGEPLPPAAWYRIVR
jgi:hypothetical protein